MIMKPLSRRTILRGVGGATLALPFLEAMTPRRAAAQTAAPVRRFFGFFYPCGTDPNTANNTATAGVRVVGAPGAPVASSLGVAMLAITLGAMGAWVLRRRGAK